MPTRPSTAVPATTCIDGGSGNDLLYGQYGADIVRGGAGNDIVHGGNGSDQVYGGSGSDTLRGSLGDDLVRGGLDDDLVFGDGGNDIVDGEAGNDQLTGGTGVDVFAFDSGDGTDTITDFADGEQIDLTGIAAVSSIADLSIMTGEGGVGSVMLAGDVTILSSRGVASWDASDFIFA